MKIPSKIKICNVKYRVKITTLEKSELAPNMEFHPGYRWGGSVSPDKRLIEINIDAGHKEMVKSFIHEVGEAILQSLFGKIINDKDGIKLLHADYANFSDELTETLQKAGIL